MERTNRLRQIVQGMSSVMDCPVTVKMRVGVYKDPAKWNATQLAAKVCWWHDTYEKVVCHDVPQPHLIGWFSASCWASESYTRLVRPLGYASSSRYMDFAKIPYFSLGV